MARVATFAYLDASAIVKLIAREPESEALRAALAAWPRRLTSELSLVEVARAAARRSPPPPASRVSEVLAGFTLLPMTRPLLESAARLPPAGLRSGDAVHLATALSLGEEAGVLIAYDVRLLEAAHAAGVDARAPS